MAPSVIDRSRAALTEAFSAAVAMPPARSREATTLTTSVASVLGGRARAEAVMPRPARARAKSAFGPPGSTQFE